MTWRPPSRQPPPQLDADMRPDDLVNELQRLKFHDGGGREFKTIRVDQQVRDYLVASLSARYVSRRD